MSEDTAVRYKDAVLYDDDCSKFVGDILIHEDGSWSKSVGDEDVSHELDGGINSSHALYKIGIHILLCN